MPGTLEERLGVVAIRMPGPGGSSMSYQLPQGVALEIQSIVAQVNPAAAAVRPELLIAEQEGLTIATRRQEDSIPAADTGEAAWSLGLSGGRAASGTATAEPFALAPISGPKNVLTGVTTNIGFDDGTLYTDSPTIFSLVDNGAGDFGLMISENGLYEATWAMQMIDTGAAPVAAPETIVVQGDDQSATSSALKTGLLLGSLRARGYTVPGGVRSEWDVSWSDAFVVNSGTVAVTPILMQATQATGSTLRVYGNVYIEQKSTNTFGL